MLFEIYEEMRDKYGFNDGASVPEGIEKVRKKIINLVNKGLTERSLIEAYPFDRSGVHNWCLIEYRNKRTGNPSGEPGAQIQEILAEAEKEGWLINTSVNMKKVKDSERDITRNYE